MMRYWTPVVVLILAGISSPGSAEHDTRRSVFAHSDERVGDLSQDWLQLQRQGDEASANSQTLTPLIQDRVYQRYMDSFEQPIPENFFSRDSFREGR